MVSSVALVGPPSGRAWWGWAMLLLDSLREIFRRPFTFVLPSVEIPLCSVNGRLLLLIFDRLLVMSFFFMDQFVLSFFIFLPAASAIFDKLEFRGLPYMESL